MMRKSRLIIGLTGTFGSGKTTATKAFQKLGAKVIDSDKLVRKLYQSKTFTQKVIKALGVKQFDRKLIAEIVFSNAQKRKRLERTVHPLVFREIRKQLARWKSGIIAIEMPLLFETGFYKKTDTNIVIVASETRIAKRLRERGFTRKEIKERQAAQWSLTRKEEKADFIIQNNRSKKELTEKIRIIFKKLSNDLKRRT